MPPTEPRALPGSPDVLRRLRGDEYPYPGLLCAGEPAVVLVDDTDLPEVVWRAEADGHLLAPLDAVRVVGGTAALLPSCRGRLGAHDAPTPGRAVTVAVSVIRGAQAAAGLGVDDGSWWLDAAGRPVLALGAGSLWREEAADLLSAVAAATGGVAARAVAEVARGIGDSAAVRRHADAWEDALFAAAEPEPLAGPATDPALGADTAPMRASALRRGAPEPVPVAVPVWARPVDGDLARRTGDALGATWAGVRGVVQRMRPRSAAPHEGPREKEVPHRRRGPVLVAVAVVGVVAALGLLWPESVPAPFASAEVIGAAIATAEASDPAAGSPAPVDASEAGPSAVPEEASALERGAREALDSLAACVAGDQDACASAREDPSLAVPDGLVAAAGVRPDISLLDEYGGVAVIRADAPGYTSQAVVLVQADEKWLVREVYDLADQP